jgi:predicted nucleic acid-binding protein
VNQGTAFWDASSLIPLFVRETVSSRARARARNLSTTTWWTTPVEIRSAFARLRRQGVLSGLEFQVAIGSLETTKKSWFEIIPSEELRKLAVDLLEQYPLRTGDSLQLAAALIWCREKPAGRQFICQDIRLCDAASQVGFTVIQL